MKPPPPDSLCLAADWLESNDGEESATLHPVAAWLRAKADAAQLAAACRANGLPVAKVRARLAGIPASRIEGRKAMP